MNTHNNFDERFEFAGKARTWSLLAIVIGVVVVLAGILTGNTQRVLANLLLVGYYMTCVCICGAFFCGVQYVAQAGWSASILRIPQAFAKLLPLFGLILIVIVAAGYFLTHTTLNEEHKQVTEPYLYSWAAKGAITPGSENYDALLQKKSGYLNGGFFFIRLVAMLAFYSIFGRLLIKYSENEDEIGGMSNYKKSFNVSAAFLAILGFTFPLFAFDAIMSLESHWFSTMFGWYNFAAMWVSGLSVMTLVMIYLKKQGYMQWITEDHLHNMGLFMFAFSIFWTYTWFAQFLLMYYANIPEEAEYFYRRWEPEFKPWFWINVVLNFAAPLLIIMSRDNKRMIKTLSIIATILVIGHWLDYFVMIMPGTVGPQSSWATEIGWIEIGVFIGAAGLFTFAVFTAISKFKSLIPKKHPFLQESLHHHI
jgi:hypothetical protein